MDHLARAMKREGIERFTTPASIICVQNAMIREQGLEPTPVRRWLLECGLSNAWGIYLCLLLAEVESYRAMADSFSLSPLVELIDRNATALQALRTLRDKLLHPTKDVPYEQTLLDYFREVESHYPIHFLFAKHLQTLLDQYLRELKDHLINTLAGDMAHLSDKQLHAFFKRGIMRSQTCPIASRQHDRQKNHCKIRPREQ